MLHEHPVVKYKTFTRVRGGDEPLLSGEEVRHPEDERDTETPLVEHNYDWSFQYLLVVPVSSLVVSIRRS